jgi:hypothetical protein
VTRWLPRTSCIAVEEGVARDVEAAQKAGDRRLLFSWNMARDEMLDRDIVVLEFLRLVLRADEKLVEPVGDADLPGRAGR